MTCVFFEHFAALSGAFLEVKVFRSFIWFETIYQNFCVFHLEIICQNAFILLIFQCIQERIIVESFALLCLFCNTLSQDILYNR